ncbi:hypothetical protein GJ699_00845 [Duganella sp. FT80W]|uniref:Methylenetetrahydrofolate reductase n=1 Tax=Duganella guangzhouensis TaxID=2666084 RepID=A0A6I2KWF2_9BURK|nr:methylenetetrahydrofolate reductase [Duganella guangzhouensis]MRW88526.1 hypothetical protein [Duganella guangzhouensis]
MNVVSSEALPVPPHAVDTRLKERIAAFMRRASTEVTTHDESTLPQLADTLPRGTTVYVAHTPKAQFDDVLRVSLKVQAAGFLASPHLVARRLPSEAAVRNGLRMLSDAGITQALLVAGDRDAALGPYANTLELLASGVLDDCGLRALGVAGHPEGHPHVVKADLWQALRHKQAFADRTGIAVHVATQFGFDPQGVHDWAAQFEQHGIDLPVHVGIAGPTSVAKLLRFAIQCGVGASLTAASKNMKAFSNVARQGATPEEIVPALVRLGAGETAARIVQPHVFAFGGTIATANWIRAVRNEEFDLQPDGAIEVRR